MRITSMFTKLLDVGTEISDDETTKLNKRFLTYMGLLMSGGGILWGSLCFIYGIYLAAAIPLGYTVLTGINFLYFYMSKNFNVVRRLQVLMSMLLPFIFQVMLGGFLQSGGVMFWAFLSLVGAMTFQNLKQSFSWMGLYLVLTILVTIFDNQFEPFSIHASRGVQTLFLSINVGVITSVIFGLLVYFVTSRNTAYVQLSVMNKELEDIVTNRTTELLNSNVKLGESNEELSVLIHQLEDKNHQIIEKNRHITDSINYAKRIQTAILTNSSSGCFDETNHFVLLKPRDIVSGDFYWFHCLPSKSKVIACVVDCTGHGVPGAFMSLIADNLLDHTVIEQGVTDPKEILEQMDLGVSRLLKQEQSHVRDGMDMSVVVFDYQNQNLEFAGANSSIVIIEDGEVQCIRGSYFPIGGVFNLNKKFEKQTLSIKPQSMVYMFTDGYADQFGGDKDRKYLASNFRNFLKKIHQQPLQDQKEFLKDEHWEWKGDRPQTDDITVVGIRITESFGKKFNKEVA